MRRYEILGGAAALLLAAFGLWRGVPPASEVAPAATEVAVPTATVSAETAPVGEPAPGQVAAPAAPPDQAASHEAPTEAVTAGPSTAASEPVPIAEAPPPPVALSALPTRNIAMRPVHVVPEGDPAPPPRPIDIRRPLELQKSASPEAVAAAPRIAPRGAPARGATQIAGAAEVSDATALRVAGRPLNLFGVRPPSGGDRCLGAGGLNLGKPPPCLQKAQDTLIARLARNPSVSCRVPAPGSATAAAICLDADGVDLGGLLVAEGLALADPAQSYDYVGAESIARSQRRGLWRFH